MNNYEKLLYKSNRQKHQLKVLQDKCHKYKEVLDKIKEYLEEPNRDNFDFSKAKILEMIEEIYE